MLKINGPVTMVLMLTYRNSTYVLEGTKQVISNGLFPHIFLGILQAVRREQSLCRHYQYLHTVIYGSSTALFSVVTTPGTW